jgi:hypothetical protein
MKRARIKLVSAKLEQRETPFEAGNQEKQSRGSSI